MKVVYVVPLLAPYAISRFQELGKHEDVDLHVIVEKYMNQYAYPLNTIRKPEIMKKLLAWSKEQGVIGLGRWGEHQHYNSDVTVDLAMKLADKLV